MLISVPDYPHIILSFIYRGWKLELDQSNSEGEITYTVWANDDQSSVVAVPCALSRTAAIRLAKQWVDCREAS